MLNKKINRRDFILSFSQAVLIFSVLTRGLERGFASAKEILYQVNNNSQDFTKAEFRVIQSIASIIIPTDENPGANEAGIAEYLLQVFQQQGAESVREIKAVIRQINFQSRRLFSVRYNRLARQQQERMVAWISTAPRFAIFWQQIRTLTVLRFYSLPQGYIPAGLPGPNVDLGGFPSIGCE